MGDVAAVRCHGRRYFWEDNGTKERIVRRRGVQRCETSARGYNSARTAALLRRCMYSNGCYPGQLSTHQQ